MGQNNGIKKYALWVTVVLALLTIGGYLWAGGGKIKDLDKGQERLAEKQETQTKSVNLLKEEGCKPARENKTEIAVINEKLDTITTNQKEMREENKEGLENIMRELRRSERRRGGGSQ